VEDILQTKYALDTFYFLVTGALVMWMAAGFAMLESGLVQVVSIQVNVAECVNKVPSFETADLCDHHGQQSIGRDIERNTEEEIGGSLVELTAQPTVSDPELEERVARRERHVLDIRDVPGADDVAP